MIKKLLTAILCLTATIACAQSDNDSLPNYELTTFQHQTIHLTDLKGKPMFCYVWKSYDPSLHDLAFLDYLEKRYADSVQFIYLCTDGFSDAWPKIFSRFPLLKGIQVSTEGKDTAKWEDFLGHYASIFIVAKDGTVFYQNNYQFEEGLDALLKE